MNISGVNDYSVMQNYKIPSAPVFGPEKKVISDVPVNDIRENPSADYQASVDNGLSIETSVKIPERKDALLEDISLTFNLQEEFGYLGQDSDIRSLDMEQAISDMKKDEVLQQYQYFVGRSQNLLNESTDGSVFVKF